MKKIIFSLVFTLTTLATLAQTQAKKNEVSSNDNSQKNHDAVVYRLFPTQNMWTFIKLNTRNGKLWQVQYNTNNNNRFETYLDLTPRIDQEREVNERFTLYSTQNVNTFILLDQINGSVWQVQWSIDPKNRLVTPIE